MSTLSTAGAVRPEWLRSSRIPSLDGLRALSIMAVTLSHLVIAPGSPFPVYWHRLKALGNPGVDVFFVISGFLITHLLLKEYESTGAISLTRFYLRRSLRILPAYILFLGVVYVLSRLGWAVVDPRAWLPSLTYTYNLVPGLGVETIGQLWSLCVEEHFYLLWPLTLVLAGRRGALFALIGTLLVAPILRFALQYQFGTAIDLDTFTLTRLDTIAFGCLLATVAHHPRSWRALSKVQGRGDLIACGALSVLCLSLLLLSDSGKYALGPKRAVEASAIGVLVYAAVADSRSIVARFLNLRMMIGIGVLSYSLYLGQFLAIPTSPWPLPWWTNLPLLLAYALFSYNVVERPMLRLKNVLESAHGAVRTPQVERQPVSV